MYVARFESEWFPRFEGLEKTLKARALKKIQKILVAPHKRHMLNGARFFVGELGQYRIVYRVFDELMEVRFYFIGTHKEYENWYSRRF